MMNRSRVLSVAGLALVLSAPSGMAAEHRHADGHVHGIAEINLAVEGKTIVVEFRSPTEGVMGFEHEAKSAADIKKRDAALKLINDRFDQLVILDGKLGCKSRGGKVVILRTDAHGEKAASSKGHGHKQQKQSGEHREVHASFSYDCERSPAGSRVSFGVTKMFPEIHELKIQVLSDTKQSGATIKKDRGDVGL